MSGPAFGTQRSCTARKAEDASADIVPEFGYVIMAFSMDAFPIIFEDVGRWRGSGVDGKGPLG